MKRPIAVAMFLIALLGCTGDPGPMGPQGAQGEQGPPGPPGGSGTGFLRFYSFLNEVPLSTNDVIVDLQGWTMYDRQTEWWAFSAFLSVAYPGDDQSTIQLVELPTLINNSAGAAVVADAVFLPLDGKVRFINAKGAYVVATVSVFRRPDLP